MASNESQQLNKDFNSDGFRGQGKVKGQNHVDFHIPHPRKHIMVS